MALETYETKLNSPSVINTQIFAKSVAGLPLLLRCSFSYLIRIYFPEHFAFFNFCPSRGFFLLNLYLSGIDTGFMFILWIEQPGKKGIAAKIIFNFN
jgi:hypothetical protein